VLFGMFIMAWNVWKTWSSARERVPVAIPTAVAA